MAITMQEFLAEATLKAATDLETTFLTLPEDKRDWSPMGDARTAIDMVAECALLNGSSTNVINTRIFPANFSIDDYVQNKVELAKDWNAVRALLKENTAKAVSIIRSVPDEDLEVQIQMPWGPMAIKQIIAYPHWNMSYHEGQINYIASMIGWSQMPAATSR